MSRSYWFPPITPVALAFTLAVGYSRVAMGRHYVSDVLAGAFRSGVV